MIHKDNIQPCNEKGERHGYWELYHKNILWFKGTYINGKISGYSVCYNNAGGVLSIYYTIR